MDSITISLPIDKLDSLLVYLGRVSLVELEQAGLDAYEVNDVQDAFVILKDAQQEAL